MMRSLLAMVLLGCGGTPVPVNRVMVGGELQARNSLPREVSPCTPSRKITVVRPNGAPIAGARIDVEQRVSEHAIEETLAVWSYRAVSTRTDDRGRAMICEPARLSPRPTGSLAIEGIGGGYNARSAGQIAVTVEGIRKLIDPPFPRELRVVISD